ncbi:MAG: hypothetical protein IKT57_02570 [Clostridia bacterium]|nr:hypothetical protein [Clostridia bacterium]
MGNRTQKNSYASAFAFIRKHVGKVALSAVMQVLLRVVALAPVVCALAGLKVPFLGAYNTAVMAAISAVMYLFLVMPLRFKAYQMVAVEGAGYAAASYGVCVAAALRRVVAGLLWGLPFIASAGLWFYAFNGMEMPDFFKILTALGNLVGGRFDAGIVLWVGGILVFGLLFAYGWWYNMPKDYAPLDKGVRHAFKRAGKMRAKNGGKFVKNALINMLLTLPSLILMAAKLAMHYVGSINFSMGAMAAAQQLMNALTDALPKETLVYLAVVVLLVHVPLCVIRKIRNAVLTVKCLKESENA